MGLSDHERMDGVALAEHVNATVRCADELTTREKLEELERLQPGSFSACTFQIGEKTFIVYSPLASPGRRQSDLAHEVAHLLLGHELKEVQKLGSLTFFSCDADEEQEANWLAGCLLLPRPLLLRAAQQDMDAADIATTFDVSEQMANYRLRATGVLMQLRRR